ncbi:RNA-binding S4 domain-containing protein [Apilactobacillus apinorum]|uniref:RQC P-site tRNA stabilizing factor n=1 Tax=Apilactobacillus apinorum TaxID=1218495 RepID=A0ABP9ZI29_9LACO|nr:RNA-binding S4 domain-containing protein [Apilactobacillus apinorum]KOY69580.1 S4 domain protein [Apilactobacillus apinorum]CAI2631972.1 S4 domain protein [Apilactobacillus apinorum]
MRLDKFLKISRIIKRRTVAKDIADQGRITVNDRVAKSSSNVVSNDILVIKFGNKTLTVQVNQLFETTKKADADRMYTVLDEKYERDFSEE